ncbi:jg4309 [Pararge aegeria aegeria]|uniref:Jg4309 protein n=1 Tax=Pararge aegeria aegeria TaxID=348720 RepID=A0A8S4QPY0_9NEOP|nr:jg4309 [Pararge aegeria aegeria]
MAGAKMKNGRKIGICYYEFRTITQFPCDRSKIHYFITYLIELLIIFWCEGDWIQPSVRYLESSFLIDTQQQENVDNDDDGTRINNRPRLDFTFLSLNFLCRTATE